MRHLQPVRRSLVAALALVVSVAAVTASGLAGATTTGGTVTCETVSGSQISPSELFSCSDSQDSQATGGAGSIPNPVPFFSRTHTGAIYWSGPTMTQAAQTVIHVRTQLVKRKKTACSASSATPGSRELKVAGIVKSDTSGVVTVGGPVTATLCQSANGQFVLLEGTTFVIGG